MEYIVQDVDECIFNSVEKHQRLTPALAQQLGYEWPTDDLPTYDEVCGAGGTNGAYGHLPGYKIINELLRNDPDFNRNQILIPGAQEALTILSSNLLVYLTTRPEELTDLTLEELLAAGFPERPVIGRPSSVPIEKTAAWKIATLEELAEADGNPKVMIDDSTSMEKAIKVRNHPLIRGILHAGPITPRGNGELTWGQIAKLLGGVDDAETLINILTVRPRL